MSFTRVRSVVSLARPSSALPHLPPRTTGTLAPRVQLVSASIHSSVSQKNVDKIAGPALNRELFPSQPARPTVVTDAVPGPKSNEWMRKLDSLEDARAVLFVTDPEQSAGNYIRDVDGNVFLDMYCHIASLSLGYNNPALIAAAKSPETISALVNRPALGVLPPKSWIERVDKSLIKIAPRGLQSVFTSLCGSSANECAIKAAFMYHQYRKRVGGDLNKKEEFSQEEIESCMLNEPPGSPHLAVLSFHGGFHGRTLGTLTMTRSKAIHKLDIPAFHWPKAPFPQLKYPLDQYKQENAEEERVCLAALEEIIERHNENNSTPSWDRPEIAAMIIEPAQAEGGDRWASAAFFRGVRRIARKHGVIFIVDEVQTGVGATGKFWAHEHWDKEGTGDDAPGAPVADIVTFSKKMQLGGFFFRKDLRPTQSYRNFNTWLGDPARLTLASTIVDEIHKHNLLERVTQVGQYLEKQLSDIASASSSSKFPMSNVRGQGTFLAFDFPNPETRDAFAMDMRKRGVLVAGCGVRTIRLRPMLVLGKQEADVFLDAVRAVVRA